MANEKRYLMERVDQEVYRILDILQKKNNDQLNALYESFEFKKAKKLCAEEEKRLSDKLKKLVDKFKADNKIDTNVFNVGCSVIDKRKYEMNEEDRQQYAKLERSLKEAQEASKNKAWELAHEIKDTIALGGATAELVVAFKSFKEQLAKLVE